MYNHYIHIIHCVSYLKITQVWVLLQPPVWFMIETDTESEHEKNIFNQNHTHRHHMFTLPVTFWITLFQNSDHNFKPWSHFFRLKWIPFMCYTKNGFKINKYSKLDCIRIDSVKEKFRLDSGELKVSGLFYKLVSFDRGFRGTDDRIVINRPATFG